MSKSNEENRPDLTPEEKVRMENEIEKLKLSAFHGAKFSKSSEELPPEIENEWLKYIAHFEKNWKDVERITVAEKLSHPEFPAVEELSESEIDDKLDNIQQLMAEHGIFLDTITDVPAAEIYRFITKELFEHEIDDVDIEGMQTVFIYEEFYPNDELDIEQTITDFILELLSKKFHSHLDIHLADECLTEDGKSLSRETAVKKAVAFSELYDQFEMELVENFEIDFNEKEDRASVNFYVSYTAITDRKITSFEGEATATMQVGKLGYWNIVKLNMPGVSF